MLRKCRNCGTEDDEKRMIEINPGRIQYICWSCYKQGHGDAASVEIRRKKRIAQYANKRRSR